MTDRAVKVVRMPDGRVYVVSPENQSEWGAWIQRVAARGPGPNAPEGPRMSDTGDPPQDCAHCYGAGCVRCSPRDAA